MTSCSGSATTVRASSASGNGFVGEVKCVCTQVGLILTGHRWKLASQTLLLQKQKAKGIQCCGSILSPNSGAGKKQVKTCSESLGKLWLGCDWQGNEKSGAWKTGGLSSHRCWPQNTVRVVNDTEKNKKTKKSMIPISGSKWWFCHSEMKDYMFSWDGKKSGGKFLLPEDWGTQSFKQSPKWNQRMRWFFSESQIWAIEIYRSRSVQPILVAEVPSQRPQAMKWHLFLNTYHLVAVDFCALPPNVTWSICSLCQILGGTTIFGTKRSFKTQALATTSKNTRGFTQMAQLTRN